MWFQSFYMNKLLLCDSLAESIKNSPSLESGVQDLMEAMAKRKYFEEELKKTDIEDEKVSKELNDVICKTAYARKAWCPRISLGKVFNIQFI